MMSRQLWPDPSALARIRCGCAVGGTLMGIQSASRAGGCTTGGFFTPLMHARHWPAGLMWASLLAGAVIGPQICCLWTSGSCIEWGMLGSPKSPVGAGCAPAYPLFGVPLLVAVGLWAAQWVASGDDKLVARAIIILAGLAMGFVLHRSRICFARAFREPFMTAEGDMTKAIILALALAMVAGSILFQKR